MIVYYIPGASDCERIILIRDEPLATRYEEALRGGSPINEVLLDEATGGIGAAMPVPNILRVKVADPMLWVGMVERLKPSIAGLFGLPVVDIELRNLCVSR